MRAASQVRLLSLPFSLIFVLFAAFHHAAAPERSVFAENLTLDVGGPPSPLTTSYIAAIPVFFSIFCQFFSDEVIFLTLTSFINVHFKALIGEG